MALFELEAFWNMLIIILVFSTCIDKSFSPLKTFSSTNKNTLDILDVDLQQKKMCFKKWAHATKPLNLMFAHLRKIIVLQQLNPERLLYIIL